MWKRICSLGLGLRVATISLIVLATVLVVNNAVFVRGYSGSAQAAMVERAKTFTALADQTKNHVAELHKIGAFNKEELLAEFKTDQAAGKPYTESKIFKTIPVVAGWLAADEAAKKEKLEFQTPSFEARNKQNEPKAGTFESELLRDLTNQVEKGGDDGIHRVDTATNSLHYMRAIKLDASCMPCHGDPATSPTNDGKDILGFQMENWKPGYMHGAFHVVMPLKPVDQQVAGFIGGSLMWTVPLFIGSGLLFLWLMRRMLSRPIGRIVEALQAVANRDLTRPPLGITVNDEVGKLAQATDAMSSTLMQMVSEIGSGAVQIDSGSSQIASASQTMAQGASEQASSLQQISASLEQMSGQIQQSAENARQANTLSQESKTSADRGQKEMAEMSNAVNEIKKSSGEISKIIKVIDEIAFQTNLLALNAAVEAARAGEAGKGFAVVAEEVRNLAQRSAEAAKNTATMIEESVKRSENGVQIAGRVGQALEEITTSTNKVNTLLSEIASAAGEQATGIGQVNQGVSQLDQVTQQNAGNSEELASSAEEMSSQVASLNELVAQFKVSNDGQRAASRPAPTQARAKTTASVQSNKAPSKTFKPTTTTRAGTKGKPSNRNGSPTPEQVIPMEDQEVLASF
jgi:methyl-accepting chemotaxis protein